MTDQLNEHTEALYKRNKYWLLLQKLKTEFVTASVDKNVKFEEWVEDKHGFKIVFKGGMITSDYEIVDDAKYTFFILKYK